MVSYDAYHNLPYKLAYVYDSHYGFWRITSILDEENMYDSSNGIPKVVSTTKKSKRTIETKYGSTGKRKKRNKIFD